MKFQGKVALVTGAGGGLGRAYAMLFAREGASVVANDLGGTRDGAGAGSSAADKVVAEIRDLGGVAVANYGSVSNAEDAQAMVDQAVREFGKIDIVVNNAGILRDKSLVKMTDDMWDLVIDVHLKGTYLVTKAAVLAMGTQGGRIINTSSLAGLLGNYGQANYGAAKAGIAGFTRVVALETRKAGITVNAIAPVAKTRMTEDISVVPDSFEPEDIAPLVAWLASDEAAGVTGRVFGAHGSHYFEYLTEQTPGVDLGNDRWTLEQVGKRFDEITATQKAPAAVEAQGGIADEARALFAAVPATFKDKKAGDWAAKIKFDLQGGLVFSLVIGGGKAEFVDGAVAGATATVTFDGPQTLMDMAAGKLAPEQAFMGGKIKTDNMGALMKFGQYFDLAAAAATQGGAAGEAVATAPRGLNPALVGKRFRGSAAFVLADDIVAYARATDESNPRYLDPDREGGLQAPPIFPVRPLFAMLTAAVSDPELNADFLRLVHGEQDIRFHRHLKPWDLAAGRAEIASIQTKASGELLNIRQWLMVDGEMTTEIVSGLFIRGESKGAGAPTSTSAETPPVRDVIYSEKQVVAADQPARYAEASLDRNPIHLDPQVALAAGHPSVILHGLCTMAFAARAVVNGVADGNPDRLKRLKVRFSKPVLPGWELETRIWKESATDGVTTYGLEVVNQDGVSVITNAIAEVA